jgi:hypothetical protein
MKTTDNKVKMILVKKEAVDFGQGWEAGSCTIRVVNVENTCKAFYKKLGCERIDIAERTINGVPFDFIVDDESCIKDKPPVFSVKSRTDKAYNLCNTLLICKYNEKTGGERGLTPPEIEWVKRNFNPLQNAVMID